MEIVLTVSDQAWGGKQRYMQQVAAGLAQVGHAVSVVVEDGSAMLTACEAAGLRTVCVSAFGTDTPAVDALREVFQMSDPSIVCVTGRADAAAVVAARTAISESAALCLFRHSAFPLGTTEEVRDLFNNVDLVFATAREQRERQFEPLVAAGALRSDQVEVLTSGISEEFLRALHAADRVAMRTQLGIDQDQFAFLVLARLSWEKGVDRVIDAFARLKQAPDPARAVLLIAGEGPLEADLRSQAEHLDVADDVHFLGRHAEVAPLIVASDAVVLASTVPETGPLALKEAMAGGRPVIASAQGGIPEFVTDEQHGLLVVDDEDLLQAMRRSAEDPRQSDAMGAAGREALLGGHRMARRLEYLVQRLDLLALDRLDVDTVLAELAWDDIRLRDEADGGFIFVPRTSQIMELDAKTYSIVRGAFDADDPQSIVRSTTPTPQELARSLYQMGALVRQSSIPQRTTAARMEASA
ncbi:putative glycosyl transferase, group 1 [Nocardia nova SH22a]|uniref:Putative glycosyl transferase, group 1 n=1 Tax=Nocardia nova SH22a TaxID=1415166 RepID=W5TH38_9NOCA|nr:glycosyltransferase family 4 protein [Nocardia nova]AHH18303.1 putative glycosyl transferase, group 1 [Nocardia nova SH22a]